MPDGFTKCGTRSRVITVYREFDARDDYRLCNRQSGLCLDVAGNSTAEGAAFDQIAYTSPPRNKFRIVKIGPFYYSFKVQSSGKLVSLASSTTSGDVVARDEADHLGEHAAFQGWYASPTGDGYFRLARTRRSTASASGSTTSGSPVRAAPRRCPGRTWSGTCSSRTEK